MSQAGLEGVSSIGWVLLPGLALLLLLANRDAGLANPRAWRLWCGGVALTGPGLALVGAEAPSAGDGAAAVAHALLLAGAGLQVAALARLLGGWLWPWALALPVVAVLALMGLADLGEGWGVLLTLLGAHLAVAGQALLAMQAGRREGRLPTLRWLFAASLMGILLLLAWPLSLALSAPTVGWALARTGWLAWPVLGSVGVLLVCHDLQRVALELRATLDGLTGVWNRRSFLEQSARALAHDRRQRQPSALLMIDIDHFKQVNDTYGHEAGDAVLRELCERIRSLLRAEDVPGRVGGEEFAVLLPGTPEEGAVLVAERIRETVAASNFLCAGEEIPVRVSIGVAERVPGEADVAPLLQRADAAMYAAKRAGRDCVRRASQLALAAPA